jgi:rhodanese-related sulfurtransferase
VIVDVRSAQLFAEGHVAGALHLPCDSSGPLANDPRIARARSLVVYGHSTEDARPVASALSQRNPGARVVVIAGGFPAWNAAGLACASGERAP